MDAPHDQGRHRLPSTSSARPATTRAKRAGCSGSTCRRFRSSTSTSSTTNPPSSKAYRGSGGRELAVLRESDASYYLREERMGWILGPYEKGAPARFADGVPAEFGKELFAGDLDRLLPHVEAAMKRVPCLEHCGIKTIVNGPISYTPDGSPLIGPAWGVHNVWLNEGHSFGVTAAGGAGWQLAEWIVEGDPGIDMLARRPAPLRRVQPASATRCARTRKPTATSSRSTTRTRSATTRAPRRPARSTTSSTGWAPCGASATAGSAPTGSRRRASSARTAGASGAATTSSTSATSAGGCARRSA